MTDGDAAPAADADRTTQFEAERPRLVALATRILGSPADAEDIVQQAWLRMDGTATTILDLPAWLTTVTGRLCLDRLRSKQPEPVGEAGSLDAADPDPEPGDLVALADTVGVALAVVLERMRPEERIAFVLHDSFGYPFTTVAAVLDISPAAARKLASRGRARVQQPTPEDALADWEVVDAFMTAARGGDFARLLELLAPDAQVRADAAALRLGTPERIDGGQAIAEFFNGAAHAALAVFVDDRAAAAWYDRGQAKVVFDFTIVDGVVGAITFRAEPNVLATVRRRKGDAPGCRSSRGD